MNYRPSRKDMELLRALMRIGKPANAMEVRDSMLERGEKVVSPLEMYSTMDKLATRGLVYIDRGQHPENRIQWMCDITGEGIHAVMDEVRTA